MVNATAKTVRRAVFDFKATRCTETSPAKQPSQDDLYETFIRAAVRDSEADYGRIFIHRQ